MTPGPVLFARYAYPPNALGYCGPADAEALRHALTGGPDLAELTHLAAGFEGAWPYLELIAGSNGITDPLDAGVVEAYWLGNGLLDTVPAGLVHRFLDDRFGPRVGSRQEELAAPVGLGALPCHSFHVLTVYPWVGLLRSGQLSAPLTVIDRCRIRWGEVETVTGGLALVRSRPLVLVGSRLVLGPPRLEEARLGLAPVEVNDTVSLHWDWVCDRLDPLALARLRLSTLRNLAAVNAAPVPGPAAAADAAG